MQYGNLVGFKSATVTKIPRELFEKWDMVLRIKKLEKEQCLLLLIEAYVGTNWTDELKALWASRYNKT